MNKKLLTILIIVAVVVVLVVVGVVIHHVLNPEMDNSTGGKMASYIAALPSAAVNFKI